MAENNDVQKVLAIINHTRVGMVTTHSNGKLVSRPMSVVEVAEDGDLWFFTTLDSDVATEIQADGAVNVAFSDSKHWVSLAATASVVGDVEKKRQLWGPVVDEFVEGGPESPNVVLLRVDAESAQFWENPAGAAALAAGWVKAKITGKPAHPGDSGTVEL